MNVGNGRDPSLRMIMQSVQSPPSAGTGTVLLAFAGLSTSQDSAIANPTKICSLSGKEVRKYEKGLLLTAVRPVGR
jgi:hypothetical protein